MTIRRYDYAESGGPGAAGGSARGAGGARSARTIWRFWPRLRRWFRPSAVWLGRGRRRRQRLAAG